MMMNRKVKDCAIWELRLIALYQAVKMLPTVFHTTYLRFFNALLEARTR